MAGLEVCAWEKAADTALVSLWMVKIKVRAQRDVAPADAARSESVAPQRL